MIGPLKIDHIRSAILGRIPIFHGISPNSTETGATSPQGKRYCSHEFGQRPVASELVRRWPHFLESGARVKSAPGCNAGAVLRCGNIAEVVSSRDHHSINGHTTTKAAHDALTKIVRTDSAILSPKVIASPSERAPQTAASPSDPFPYDMELRDQHPAAAFPVSRGDTPAHHSIAMTISASINPALVPNVIAKTQSVAFR